MGSSPRLLSLQVGHLGVEPRSSCSQSRRAPICTSARIVLSVDLQGVEPEALSASQSADPSASPLVVSVTRVGFEPDLAGLKDQKPHQKLNEPLLVMQVRTSSAVFSCEFLPGAHPVDWDVLEPSSAVLQTAAIPSQLPVHLCVKRWKKARKNRCHLGNTGSPTFASLVRAGFTSDVDVRGTHSRFATRYIPHIR